MSEELLPGPSLTDLRLDLVGDSQWRVCDRRFRETNGRTLLGFVEQKEDQYEVTRAASIGETLRYPSIEAALAAFVPVKVSSHNEAWSELTWEA